MAASWKSIDRLQSGNRTTEVRAVRIDTNSRDVEFFREVLILVGIPEQEAVAAMSEEELQTYVENHVDMTELDKDIANEDAPPESEYVPSEESEESTEAEETP
jgi:hypothetical protein